MSYQNQTYVENEGTYHYVTAAGANYTIAQSICRDDFQSQLAVLNTQQLFDKAKSLSGAGTFFIGLHRPNDSVPYQWLDGSAFNRSLINGPSITNENGSGCRGVVMQIPGQSNSVNLTSYDCSSKQNFLCFTPAQLTTTTTSTEEATTATRAATTSQAFVSTTSYDTTTTTLSPTTNTVLTKVQPTTQLYNSTQTTTTGLTNTQSVNAGGLQLGIVVGIPLGVVLLLILLIALIVWLKRRGGDKSNEADVSLETNKGQDPPTGTYNRADVGNEDDQCEVHLNVLYDTGANDATNNEEDEEADIGDLYAKVNKQSVQKQQQDYGESYDVLHENNTAFIAEAEELYSGLNKT
uniref:uncharacterized protein LOC113475647 n=1 Tax=Ciona intestinalis TaxID=7719 RepID=UPI000EF52ED8|nr:uncharacterized protein LOC113475647 [Ciona intestinalis]|eukprot:XP_026695866.1 uncharacterized protein LOC113475647 [Ciona intestinalis]